MNRKNIVLVTLTLLLVSAAGTGAILRPGNLLPRVSSANAITCPTGGTPTNGCLTVSLDAISRPTPGGGPALNCQTPTAPASQPGVCDILINTSASNVTTFRIGAILNATTGSPATSNINCGPGFSIMCGVFGFQYAINYDPTIVTPVGDPSSFCNSYPDCGEPAIWYGSQTVAGGVNWYSLITSSTQPTSISENGHTGKITVGFGFLAPLTPKVTTTKTVLASVAFAEVSPGTATFSISDVIFGDQNGVTIPGITGAPTTSCTLASCGMLSVTLPNTPPHSSFTTSHTGTSYTFTSTSTAGTNPIANYVWDFGDKTPIVIGPTMTSVTHDYGLSGVRTAPGSFIVTLRVADNKGLTSAARDKAGNPIFPYPPGGTGAPEQAFVNQGIVELGASPSFTFNPATPTAGQTVSFDASGSTYPDEPLLAGMAPVGGTALTSTAAGDSACNLTVGLPCPVGFVDNNANGIFDPGVDIVVRDNTGLGTCTFGSCDVLAGPSIPLTGQTVLPDGKISWDDINADGSVNPGEPLIYDTNGNTLYDGIKSYHWDFGDGSAAVTMIIPTTSHTFANTSPAAGYPVKLIVTDNPALTSSITNNVVVLGGAHTTTTSVSCSPSTITTSETSTCTVTVTDNLATGATTPTGTLALSTAATGAAGTFTPCALASTATAGQAQCTSTFTPSTTGTASITGIYSGDPTHSPSTSTAVTVAVTPPKHSTTTSVSCTLSTLVIGQSTSCTATVTDTATTSPTTPTGTVTFTSGAFCTLAGTGASATCSITVTAVSSGTSTVSGSYAGDSTHASSGPGTANIAINKRATTISVSCTPSTIDVGQSTSCTATVTDTDTGTASTPTGTVDFSPSATCTLSGTGSQASCAATEASTPFPPSLFVTATYGGDTTHAANGPSAAFTVIVQPRTTTTHVSCPSATVNIDLSCTATVTDSDTGTSSTPIGQVNVNSVTCTLSGTGLSATCNASITPSAAGSLSVTASYAGDATHAISSGSTTVTVAKRTTTTTVNCTPSSITTSQTSNCTATVADSSLGTSSTPTGGVTWTASIGTFGATTSCTLSSGSCSVTFSSTTTGSATITANYGGDTIHAVSSNTATIAVGNLHATTTTVACTPTTIDLGQTTSCTATVTDTSGTPTIPTGSLTFAPSAFTCTLQGTTTIGVASCSFGVTPPTVGPFAISPTYPGDSTHASSTGSTSVTVNLRTTNTTVSCPASGTVGTPFNCTVTVTDTDTGTSSTPGGVVTFTPSGTCNPSGTGASAMCTVSITPSAAGPLTVTANYLGDATVHAVSTGSATVSISQPTAHPTTTSVACVPTTVVIGEATTCTATVTDTATGPTTPTGTVTFTPSGTCTLSGTGAVATCSVTISFTAAGSPKVSATYNPDATHSTSTNATGVTVNLRTTTTAVACSPASVASGSPTACTATVTDSSGVGTGSPPTGTVAFTTSGTGTFSSSSCTLVPRPIITALDSTCSLSYTTSGPVGTDTITGTYAADSTHATSSGTGTVIITVSAHATTTSISCTPTTIVINQGTTCTSTVTDTSTTGATTPTGNVFWTPSTSCSLSGSGPTATCDAIVSANTVGQLLVTANYQGDGGHSGSTSNTVTITGNARSTSTSLVCVPSSIAVGQTATCTATVTDNDVGSPRAPSGTVTFTTSGAGGFTGSPCTFSTSGPATCQITYTPSGTAPRTDTITADYSGDTSHLGSRGTFLLSITQPVTTPGHAKLIQWRADAKFNPDNLRRNPTQVLRAYGLNNGTVTVNVYVQFVITNPDGTTNTIYTRVVSLTLGQSINGRLDNRFTASFTTLPGRTNVTATLFYSSVSSTIGDVSFTPDTASAKTFSFNALGVRTDDFNFEDDITSASQSFDVSVQNAANIDLISRIDITIRQPDRTTTSYVSDTLLLQSGQNGEIKFIVPLTGPDGTYCFTATVKYGIDTNHNGQLDNNEILGTSGRQHDCFSADTDDAPAGSIIAPPMTIAHVSTDDCDD